MAPSHLRDAELEIELQTHWWPTYPVNKFSKLAHAEPTLNHFIQDVYRKPRKLARSASTSNLTYIREADVSETVGLKRSPSFSSLSPSHMLVEADRKVERLVPAYSAWRPPTAGWFYNSYMPHCHWEMFNFKRPKIAPPTSLSYSGYRPLHNPSARPFVYYKRYEEPKSYLTGFREFNRDADRRRLKADVFASNYAYRNFDQDINHRFTRLVGVGRSAFTYSRFGPPINFASQHAHRVYSLRQKVIY